jgi:hypothetical protein
MEAVMTQTPTDRRRAKRRGAGEHGIQNARIRPGHPVTVIDCSSGGALVEAECRLLPGSMVDLHVESDRRHAAVRGRVVRCSVVRVRPSSMCYRGAIAFDRYLPWFVEASGYPLPSRGDATPERL